jgi:hypothetical protein
MNELLLEKSCKVTTFLRTSLMCICDYNNYPFFSRSLPIFLNPNIFCNITQSISPSFPNHMSHVTIIACNHSIAIALPIPPMIVTVKPYYQHHLSYPHCIYKLMDYNPHGYTPVIPQACMCHSQLLPIIY